MALHGECFLKVPSSLHVLPIASPRQLEDLTTHCSTNIHSIMDTPAAQVLPMLTLRCC